jgi:hypothetical protein
VSAPKMLESLWAIRFLKVSDAEAPEDVKATLDVDAELFKLLGRTAFGAADTDSDNISLRILLPKNVPH